ncbi:2-C-methyl-D-erythritol 4-phosphate cytidylyltransferase [Butyrivibrio sp. JL13D10]|uniref:IspD/TarI family cytidylyltransferase n=1 Tax=Butyrivibrio sp. JL13D10 TaxID=3236815 RepID=UPI0038B47A97
MQNIALIFAGGAGKRMNSRGKPKQFLEIYGKPIIIHTIEQFENHSRIDAICIVSIPEWKKKLEQMLLKYGIKKVKWIVNGGETALDSQFNGLKAIEVRDEKSVVLIHDGVRPLIDEKLITECIEAVYKFGSAITVAPAIETIVMSNGESNIVSSFDREKCLLARAPQCFFLDEILETHRKAIELDKHDFIDSVSMMLYFGKTIHIIQGPSENIKVTTPTDYYICRALMDARDNSQIYGL